MHAGLLILLLVPAAQAYSTIFELANCRMEGKQASFIIPQEANLALAMAAQSGGTTPKLTERPRCWPAGVAGGGPGGNNRDQTVTWEQQQPSLFFVKGWCGSPGLSARVWIAKDAAKWPRDEWAGCLALKNGAKFGCKRTLAPTVEKSFESSPGVRQTWTCEIMYTCHKEGLSLTAAHVCENMMGWQAPPPPCSKTNCDLGPR